VASTVTAHLNDTLEALVLPDRELIEDLISINPIVDLGYEVTFEPYDSGGVISKDGVDLIRLHRRSSKWLIDMNSLNCLVTGVDKDGVLTRVLSLHKRMGHASSKNMQSAIALDTWTNAGVTANEIRAVMDANPCPICLLAKKNRLPIPQSLTDPKEVPIGHLISGDIIGPIKPEAGDGAKYFFLFVDRRTSLYHVFTSKSTNITRNMATR